MPTKTAEQRVARAEEMLCLIVNRLYGHITKGHKELLNARVEEIRVEIVAR
jgi:hypothetical protein